MPSRRSGVAGKQGKEKPATASTPKLVHFLLAFVMGLLCARLLVSREVHVLDAVAQCGEVRQDQYSGKEVAVGYSDAGLKAGSLKRILDKAENGTVILTFANSKYKDSMINWLSLVERQNIRNYAIVCLDSELPKWLAEHRGTCSYHLTGWKPGAWTLGGPNTCAAEGQRASPDETLPLCKLACEQDVSCQAISWDKAHRKCYLCPGGYSVRPSPLDEIHLKRTKETLWYHRWKLLLRLLNKNVHVLMADLDALFVRDPLPLLHQYGGQADVISQRGSFPKTLYDKWGSCICMGFTYWRSTEATKIFTATVHKMIASTGDDQVGVNMALDQSAVEWRTQAVNRKVEYETSKEPSIGLTNKGLRVLLLPHSKFPRKCEEYGEGDIQHSYVAHCYVSAKQGDAKMKEAKKFGLWSIKQDWETVDAASVNTFSEYLDLVRSEELRA
eukprot:TRINITY_DN10985_c0_g2_i1.p1 TRINITY_DN10985_c0_g2~~TRINITY_DN10985_c0_g2_i1.p1  ORF type:complete len:443 (+),score=119.05 TRINITY_DN10985_c0_g2_i1:49-1377(+)